MVHAGRKNCCVHWLASITQNEAALAVVMGHEVSHAIFQHGNERMSQELGSGSSWSMGLQVALANKPAETQNCIFSAYGAGAQVGVSAYHFPVNMNWKLISLD